MRIRTIKPQFWRSDDITRQSREDRLLFIGLWSYVDDNGVGIDDYRAITADLFAFEEDQAEVREFVREGLARLSRGFLMVRYEVGGKRFIYIPSWDRHQRVDKPNKPRYPRPEDTGTPPTSGNANGRANLATPSRHPRESVDRPPDTIDTGRNRTQSENADSGASTAAHPIGAVSGVTGPGTRPDLGKHESSRGSRESPATGVVEVGVEEERRSTKNTRAPRSTRETPAAGFDEFWTAYPRKEGKRKAQQAYTAALKRGAEPAELLSAARHYRALTANTEPRFIAHPATWLNQGRYDDEPPPQAYLPAVAGSPPTKGTTTQRVNAILAFKRGDPR